MAAAALVAGTQGATAEPGFSAWAANPHSAARLIALGGLPSGGAVRQAALEIRLDPGYLTYWRQPGDAGLPPTLDTTASQNVTAVAVDFPAPRVFDEAGAQLFGYRGTVVLPLRVTLADAGRPATLAVDLDYAVCAAICLPGKAHLSLALPDSTAPDAEALIAGAQAAVPRPSSLGGPGALAVMAVAPDPAPKPTLRVTTRAATPPTLFVEGPEGWFFTAGAAVAHGPGAWVVPVTVTDQPNDARGPLDLRLTLVDGADAIDVPVHMDARLPKP